jgi:hypothetical protein
MPNRAERRAAERAALKAARKNRTQNPTVVSTAAPQPVAAELPNISGTFIPPSSDFTINPVDAQQAEVRKRMADYRKMIDDLEAETNQTAEVLNSLRDARETSEAQINANRENAKKSTGPTSEAGKATVSQNRRTHGLLGRFLMLPDENPADYDELIDSINNEFHPETDDEYRLALSTAQHYWLSQRALRLQEQAVFEGDHKKLALFMRYESQHERSYLKARKELKAAIKERTSSEIGFESQKAKNEALEARARLQNAKAEDLEIDTLCKSASTCRPSPATPGLALNR